jgi:hypothetical protein
MTAVGANPWAAVGKRLVQYWAGFHRPVSGPVAGRDTNLGK